MLKVPNAAERLLLIDIRDGQLTDCVVKLYSNDHTPEDADVVGDYTEATFSGYADETVATWDGPFTNDDGKAEVVGPTLAFAHNGGGVSETIHGYFVVNAGGALLFAERFQTPKIMLTAADAIILVPTFTGASEG